MTGRGNPLLDAFIAGPERSVHKWLDYFSAYDRLFSHFRGKPITFLEIGVQNGGSMLLWRDYFGEQATILGADVDPTCRAMEDHGFEIWIGDQADPTFWTDFKVKHPKVDIILDDGGHTMQQQLVTLECLFPTVSNGGFYVVEDTHTSYFPSYGGGPPGCSGTFLDRVKGLIDEMHSWYHAPIGHAESILAATQIPSITIFDSIVAIEKRQRTPPISLARGCGGGQKNPLAMDYLDLRRALGIPDDGI